MRRDRCQGCGYVWRQDASQVAQARSKASRASVHWGLEALVCQHLQPPAGRALTQHGGSRKG